jgi:hypothetical protein
MLTLAGDQIDPLVGEEEKKCNAATGVVVIDE